MKKLFFTLLVAYYVFDAYLSKVFAPVFIIGRFRMVKFDWVAFGGIFAIFHVGFIIIAIPAIILYFFVFKAWPKKVFLLYFVTAILFYGTMIYGLFKGESFNFFQIASLSIPMFIFGLAGFFLISKLAAPSSAN